MKYGFVVGAVALSAAILHGGPVWGQDAGQSLRRALTVAQTVIYDARPIARPSTVPADGNALQVVAWVDRPDYTYAIGEQVRLFVETNRDAWVVVLSTGPDGRTTLLFPNSYQRNHFVKAGRAVEVPGPAAPIRIAVNQPVGHELLKVMASTTPFSVGEALQLGETNAFPEVRTSARATARSLTVLMNGDTSEPDAAPVLSNTLGGRIPAPALDRRQRTDGVAAGAMVTQVASGREWALCHQAITTISAPVTVFARLSRSLTVENVRTRESRASVRCEEMR